MAYSLKWNYIIFNREDISKILDELEGVYAIYYIDNYGRYKTVYVGKGEIKSRLISHLSKKEKYVSESLEVAYSEVPKCDQGGVEHYVADELKPEMGCEWPKDSKIEVELPYEK